MAIDTGQAWDMLHSRGEKQENAVDSLFHRFTRWLGSRQRNQQTQQSADLLQRDLLRLHPDAGKRLDVPALIAMVRKEGLVYDGALESGVAGLYPAVHQWPQHPTIKIDLINWPKEGVLSFWPPVSRTRPAIGLPAHAPREDQAILDFTPDTLPQALAHAVVLSKEAFEFNRAHASLDGVMTGGALDRS